MKMMKKFSQIVALIFLALVFMAFSADARKKPLYKNPKAPIEDRVEDLLSRMTLEEKCAQVQNRFINSLEDIHPTFEGKGFGTVYNLYEDVEDYKVIMDSVQRYMVNSTRLGIPAIITEEGIQGIIVDSCTIFPHAIAQGSTFDPELVGRMASACADEAEYLGIRQVLSPVFDIPRDLRWGRVEETYGEDPFLIAEMGIGFINGYQKGRSITCTPKHFVAHGSPTGGLNTGSVSGGERELRSLYLYPFRRVIAEARPRCIMSCYSSYDGVAVTGSRYYMTDLLRGELGFDGYTYSDWGSVERLIDFHWVAKNMHEAAKVALEAGIDLNVMFAYGTLQEQFEKGEIDMKYLDEAVRHILKVKFELGLFENPFSDDSRKDEVHCAEHLELAKEIADESAILLENNGILPLDMNRYGSVAVIGPNSDQTVFGDYSWTYQGTDVGVTLLEGIRNRFPQDCKILHAEGCDWWSQDGSGIEEAVRVASQSDLIIAAVGSRSTYLVRKPDKVTCGEGYDLSSLELPGRQMDLLKALKATGKPLVVVLIAGKPFAMPWVKENADAFLVQWYAGEEQGNSAADILLGNVNPSGRLNVSFPRSTGNTPCYYNYLPTDREYYDNLGGSPESPAARYIFEKPYALWNFGYGLSYSDFNYLSCTMDASEYSAEDGVIRAEVEVENVSGRDGKEVVQLYVRDLLSSVATPIKQLKAFRKVMVPAGEKVKVRLEVPVDELALYNERMERVVEPGEFEIQIGSSSDRIHFRDTVLVR